MFRDRRANPLLVRSSTEMQKKINPVVTQHRLALMVIAYRYTGEETANLRRIFSSYDEDETGTLDVEELKRQFALRDKYSKDEIDSIFMAVVRSLALVLDFSDFCFVLLFVRE
jgi:Ca2+-binding EF-hand superfamily protein